MLAVLPAKADNVISKILNSISEVDTTYIRPQEYNWAAMVQGTTTYESYRLRTEDGNNVRFTPVSHTKIGPYAGWRWLFLGYTFDVKDVNFNQGIDIDFSFYAPIFSLDLLWKDSENKSNSIADGGISTIVKGFNFNYVLSHKRFSYPAAFAQSSCQKMSAGSAIVGAGYLYHQLNIDNSIVSILPINKIEHGSLSFSGGYAYNYVPLRNVLFGSSLTIGVAFKKTFGDGIADENFSYRDFNLNNVNLDACGRFALVYNNMKWFAGASSIIHYYTYNRGQFSTANWHAVINLYAGFNFGKRR